MKRYNTPAPKALFKFKVPLAAGVEAEEVAAEGVEVSGGGEG